MPHEPSPKTVESWNDEIARSGIKRLKARVLLEAFGAERRGSDILDRMRSWSRTNGLHLNGLDYATSLDDVISVSRHSIRRIGRLVEHEAELTARFEREIAPKLGLRVLEKGYCPPGTEDRFDFLCHDTVDRLVMVELERGDGERRAVEQLQRCVRVLRDGSTRDAKAPRGLLITGEADLTTRRALQRLEPGCNIDWWLYGLREDGSIALEPEVLR